MTFFRTVTVAAAEAGRSPDLLTRLRAREIDGVAVVDRSASEPDLDATERVPFRLDPGDMIIVNSGHCLHRATSVVGSSVCWTACSFMAESKAGDRVYCWG
jgi:hypothetical protein